MNPQSLPPATAARANGEPTPGLLSPVQQRRFKAQVLRAVCSGAWFDTCWAAVSSGQISLKRAIHRELDRVGIYPPGGSGVEAVVYARERTAMRRCACCDRWFPPYYVRLDARCEDCHAAAELPLALSQTDHYTHRPSTCSPTALALR